MRTLYWAKGACSFAPHVVLEELGEKFEAVQIDPLKPRSAEFLKLHPRGHVPLLVDGDHRAATQEIGATLGAPRSGGVFVLTEAHAIMVHVGEKLLPAPGTKERARVHELCGLLSTSVHIGYRQVRRPNRFTDDEAAFPGIRKHGAAYLERLFAELEQRVGDGPWAIGAQYTIADPYLVLMHRWGHTAEVDMKPYPRLADHSRRVRERPAVQRVIEREGMNPWP